MSNRKLEPNEYDGTDHLRKSPENHFLEAVGRYPDRTKPGTVEALGALAVIVRSEPRKQKASGSA